MKKILFALLLALSSATVLAAVNLNSASKDELVALPGIGPAKAQAILDYRAAHGPFKSIEELKDVKGIGTKQFEKLKPELTVGNGAAKVAAPAKADAAPRSAKGDVLAATPGRRDPAAAKAKP